MNTNTNTKVAKAASRKAALQAGFYDGRFKTKVYRSKKKYTRKGKARWVQCLLLVLLPLWLSAQCGFNYQNMDDMYRVRPDSMVANVLTEHHGVNITTEDVARLRSCKQGKVPKEKMAMPFWYWSEQRQKFVKKKYSYIKT